jgi:hypothetical protein
MLENKKSEIKKRDTLKHELLFGAEKGIKAQHTKQSETNQNEKRDEVLIL